MTTALRQLVSTRSRLAETILGYLREVEALPEREYRSYLCGRDIRRIYVEPDVFKAKAGDGRKRSDVRDFIAHSMSEENMGTFASEGEKRVPWFRELRSLRRGVIVGRPGEGKTLLAQMTACRVARDSREKLQSASAGIDQVQVPLILRLSEVVGAGLSQAVRDAVDGVLAGAPEEVRCLCQQARLADHLLGYLSQRPELLFLILDGLDEVAESDRPAMSDELNPLSGWRGKALITTRPYGYAPSALALTRTADHYRLAPFRPKHWRGFVNLWFDGDDDKAAKALQTFRTSPRMRDMAGNGLLLTLTCAVLTDSDLPENATRADVYEQVIERFCQGEWRKSGDATCLVRRSLMRRILGHVAWTLFQRNPAGNAASDDRWDDAMVDAKSKVGVDVGVDTIFEWLSDSGLIVHPGRGQTAFLHRSFLEYLSAWHVARLADPVAEIEQFLWQPDPEVRWKWTPAAGEMLAFLAACMGDAAPLAQRLVDLDRDQRDLNRTMLFLAGRVLSEAHSPRGKMLSGIVDELVTMYLASPWQLQPDLVPSLANSFAVGLFIYQLDDGDKLVRYMATEALGAIADAAAVPPLIDRLGDDDNEVRGEAARSLGAIGDAAAIPHLIDRLGDDEKRIRWAAAEALGRIGDTAAVPPLIDRLGDDNPNIRGAVAEALGAIGDATAIPHLIDRLDDEDKWVRRAVAEALGGIGDAAAVPHLIGRLGDDYEWTRSAVAEALGAIGDAAAVPPLIDRLGDDDEGVRMGAAEALGAIGDAAAVPPLIDRLGDGDEGLRSAVADALGAIGDAAAVPPLIDRLGDDDSEVRGAAAKALGAIGDATAVPHLIDRLGDDESRVRWAAARSLRDIGDATAVRHLIDRLGDNNEWSRCVATEALGAIGDAAAIPPLIDRLDDESKWVRKTAADALVAIGDAAAVPHLIDRLADDDGDHIKNALMLLCARNGWWAPALDQDSDGAGEGD